MQKERIEQLGGRELVKAFEELERLSRDSEFKIIYESRFRQLTESVCFNPLFIEEAFATQFPKTPHIGNPPGFNPLFIEEAFATVGLRMA